MAFKLSNPIYIEESGCWIYPDADNVSLHDRLFIVCDNNALAETIISNINEYLSHRSLTSVQLSELADDIITSGSKDFSSSSLALLLINKSNCLTLQMGKSRIVHISTATGDIEYDSSNHILDSYSSKAKTQLINRINRDDVIILTLADRVDTQRLLNIVCNTVFDDDNSLLNELLGLLGKHREQPPATYYLKFIGAGGAVARINNIVKDINWKWITVFLLLAALIVGLSLLSLNGNMLRFTTDDQKAETLVDSDSINAPVPAIQDISDIDEVDKASIKNLNDTTKSLKETINETKTKGNTDPLPPSDDSELQIEPVKPVQPVQEDPAMLQVPPTPVPDNPQE